jgi:hypothetical protein
MYKITYANGYVRKSQYMYGDKTTKNKPDEILKSEEIIEDESCPSEHWLFSGENK